MKRLISLALVGMFGLSILGCHASVEPVDNGDSHYKKTTTVDNNGNTSVKTETKTEKTY